MTFKRLKIYLAGDNFLVDLNGLIGEKGRISSDHFVYQHAEGPPVYSLVITLKFWVN